MFDRFGVDVPSGILHGPPGNGKTLLAKAVANETGRTFVSVAGAELVNSLGTGTEQRLRDIFEKARWMDPPSGRCSQSTPSLCHSLRTSRPTGYVHEDG
jgi:transitional endoplasmic reticulum ATPase